MKKYICAVCGYDQLDKPQWQDKFPSHQICDCCFFQPGFDNDGASDPVSVEEYRKRWLESGSQWRGSYQYKPEHWDASAQLKNIHIDPDQKEKPIISGIGHITFSVANMERAMTFYINVLAVQPILIKPKTVYFEIAGIWLALNLQEHIPRQEIYQSYTHIAFSIKEEDIEALRARLQRAGATIEEGRQRNAEGEGQSIYFRDPDGHLLEFHTGTLEERLDYYRT